MPSLRSYKNDPGYYIRARPPEVGNINYKIKDEGYSLVEALELPAKDEISWDTINALKAMKLIYTDGSGVIGPDDGFQPNPEEAAKHALSEEEAKDVLATIRSNHDLTDAELAEIRNILGISETGTDFEALGVRVETWVQNAVSKEIVPTERTVECDPSQVNVSVTVKRGQDDAFTGFSVSLYEGENSSLFSTLTHHIGATEEDGLQWWKVAYDEEFPWGERAELDTQVVNIRGLIVAAFKMHDVDPGDATRDPETEYSTPHGVQASIFFEAA